MTDSQTFIDQLLALKGIIFDIDGIFTDGTLHYTEQGEALKIFHVHDGLGVKMLHHIPIKVGVISGGHSPILIDRLKSLDIDTYEIGCADKLPACQRMLTQWELSASNIAYMGDDLPDLPVMQEVGLSITVSNANPLVAAYADWQTQNSGGNGAVREVCDKILQTHQCIPHCLEALGHGKLFPTVAQA